MSQRNITSIARPEAMSQFSSTEQLDQRLVVVRGAAWLLLLLAAALVALALVWGFLGQVPRTIDGQGIIVPRDTRPVEVMSASAYGGVVELIVPEYGDVKAGDPIVRLDNEDLNIALAIARRHLADLQAQDRTLTTSEDQILAKRKSSRDEQIAMSRTIIDQTNELVEMFQEEVKAIEVLVKDRLLPRSQLVSTRSSLYSSMQQVIQQQTQEAQVNIEFQSLVNTTQQSRLNRMQAIAGARDDVKSAETKIATSTIVRAPISGRLLEYAVDLGSALQAGTMITSIRPRGQSKDTPIEVIAFVPFGLGKEIRTGMPVQVSLSYAKPSRYGYIEGVVDRVGEFVAGVSAEIQLGSSALAQSVAKDLGPVLEVVVKIEMDPDTASGLSWTSGRGYPKSIDFPSLCGIRVITAEDRPMDLVVPWLKNTIGLDPEPSVLSRTEGPE